MTIARLVRSLTLLIALPCAALAQHEHSDIDVSIGEDDAGITRIITGDGDSDDPDHPIVRGVRIFESETGEGGTPGFTDEPGFNALPGELPANAILGFDLIDALRVWNGSDFETLATNTMQVSLFTESRLTPPDPDGFTEGFDFATVSSNGTIHSHLNFFLTAPELAGVYLLTFQLRLNTPGIEPSQPTYIVFNHESTDEQTDAAIDYLASLIEPSTCPADVTGDNAVNLADLNLVLANFGQKTSDGDTNDDGSVDLADLNAVLAAFGQACP